MKIKEKDGTILDVFAIYWLGNENLFLGLPKNYGGLLAYNAKTFRLLIQLCMVHLSTFPRI
jgi:hypothetical protein